MLNKEKVIEYCNQLMVVGLIIYSLSAVTSTSGISIGIILTLIAWLCRMSLLKRIELQNIPLNLPIFIFLGISILSLLNSHLLLLSFDRLRSIIEKILLYYLVINGIKNERQIKWLIALLLITTALLASYELGILIFSHAPERFLELSTDRALGACLGMVIPIGVSWLLVSSSWRYRIGLGCCLILMIICLIFTSTRGAWLGILAALTFIGLVKERGIFIWVISLIIIFFLRGPKYEIERAANIFNPDANIKRIYLWQSALSLMKEHPFLGNSPGGFQLLHKKYLPNDKIGKEINHYGYAHAHNIYLHTAAETGLTGLLILIWLLVSALRSIWRISKRINHTWSQALTIGILASLIDFIVHGLVDYTLAGKTGYLLWFLLGIAHIERNKDNG